MRSLGLLALLGIIVFVFASSAQGADAYSSPAKRQRAVSKRRRLYRPVPVRDYVYSPSSNDLSIAPAVAAKDASAAKVGTTQSLDAPATKRFMNLRIHPIHLLYMATQQDTLASARADLDFVLGEKVTLGASVIYHQTSAQDTAALAGGVGQSVDLGVLEVGLLSNIYLTGTTSTGGFLLRPHVYWIDASGSKDNGTANGIAASSRKNGVRAGSELIYQIILPAGFNLEIGGGFTYHLEPYAVDYPAPGLLRSEPDNRFVPTVSAGVGWAF